jgi:hypothetical protein
MRSSPGSPRRASRLRWRASPPARSAAARIPFVLRDFGVVRARVRGPGGALCRPLSSVRCRSQGGNHGASDPGARAGNGPARVRRGRSRHGCRCRVSVVSVVRAPLVGPEAAAKQVHMCARNGTQISSGQSGPARAGNPGPELRSFVAHFEVRNVSTIGATLDTSAITRLMLDLCSAPCKARRFAPPVHTRGLRALTVPARRSRLGHYVMAGDECRDRRSGPCDL